MSSKMLIDASHPEETRVVVMKGQRVEEFDFESASKRQLRGNIYLAKVTRVEPSLQAAFIEYGGNRHGFLAFSEIHPDYYQIPVADRQALIEEEARAHRDEDEESRNGGHRRSRRNRRETGASALERRDPAGERVSEPVTEGEGSGADPTERSETESLAPTPPDTSDAGGPEAAGAAGSNAPGDDDRPSEGDDAEPLSAGEAGEDPRPHASAPDDAAHEDLSSDGETRAEARDDRAESVAEHDQAAQPAGEDAAPNDRRDADRRDSQANGDENGSEDQEEEVVEQIGGDALEDAVQRAPRPRRNYKIQEVIKRRQILLIQVVKEERGNKGAALTTYLSLAGRYSVLMPNTARGGGISRKITDSDDRKRLKEIAHELEVPEGMGVILRTAGAARSNVEVRRDFEYLLRMWESVRELTLKSTAPALVYEEGSLIKRSIRDLYSNDVEEVIVAGEAGHREARDFMRMLMPTATKSVQLYRDPQPLFAKAGAEAQLDAMFSNHVTLRSGGYLVINQTEALVAIDVNSGRSTREHNIEDTALRTNLEAADEVARQLRLRDLAGLIVVDFIDMEEGRNNRAVERRIKEALKNDRARIQIGRISHFGLLEMSRQRIRTGVLEGSTVVCPHCAGSGTIRSTASLALHVLRLLEDALIKDASHNLVVRTRSEVALYILNQKRSNLIELERRFGVSLTMAADPTLTGMIYHAIERGEPALPAPLAPRPDLVRVDSVPPVYDDEGAPEGLETAEGLDEEEPEAEAGRAAESGRDAASSDQEADGTRRRKRRRRRRGRDREAGGETSGPVARSQGFEPETEGADAGEETVAIEDEDGDVAVEPGAAALASAGSDAAVADEVAASDDARPVVEGAAPAELEGEPAGVAAIGTEPVDPVEPPRRRRSRRAAPRADDDVATGRAPSRARAAEPAAPAAEPSTPAPRRSRRAPKARAAEEAAIASAAETLPADPVDIEPDASTALPTTPEPVVPASLAPSPDPGPADAASDVAVPSPDPESRPAEKARAPGRDSAEESAGEPGPALPKRSGWWQRAKATFGS